MERIVHVCNGDSTADSLSLADLPGEIRVWADALDRGPVRALPDDEHYRVRDEFWASRGGDDPLVRARPVRSARADPVARATAEARPARDSDDRLDRSASRDSELSR